MNKSIFLLLLSSCLLFGKASAQLSKQESQDLKAKVEQFYLDYATAIKGNTASEAFEPKFVPQKDGMMTLNFSAYTANLRKYDFTDSLIEVRVQNYLPCLRSLKKISSQEFQIITAPDQFEKINCAFSTVHEWTADKKAHDGAIVEKVKILSKGSVKLIVRFFVVDPNNERLIWDHKHVEIDCRKEEGVWKIANWELFGDS